MLTRSLKLVVLVPVLVAHLAVSIPASAATPAHPGIGPVAADPDACYMQGGPDQDVDRDMGEERGIGANSNDLRGVSAQVWITEAALCRRISSLFIYNRFTGATMEFGIVVGHGVCGYAGTYYRAPRFFWTFRTPSGLFDCNFFPGSSPGPEQTHQRIALSDSNQNGAWTLQFNDNTIANVQAQFSKGFGGAQAERASVSDEGFAEFKGLKRYLAPLGQYGAWSFFEGLQAIYENDEGATFYFDVVNVHWGKVRQ